MTDQTCERCRRLGAQYVTAWELTLCPSCADEYRRIEAAGSQLRALLQPTIRLWAAYWRERGLAPQDLRNAVELITEDTALEI